MLEKQGREGAGQGDCPQQDYQGVTHFVLLGFPVHGTEVSSGTHSSDLHLGGTGSRGEQKKGAWRGAEIYEGPHSALVSFQAQMGPPLMAVITHAAGDQAVTMESWPQGTLGFSLASWHCL